MRTVQIPKKKKNEFRTIYIPNKEEKQQLKYALDEINTKAQQVCGDFVHGFMLDRSAVTNASSHVGYQYTTCFDLKDFFDSVQESHLEGKLTKNQIQTVLVDGAPRQGLPTSPAVANIAATELDKAILNLTKKYEILYTRYADDLSFSYNDIFIKEILLKRIPEITSMCGFKINKSKTHTMSAKSGRRIITGVAVDDKIHPTRATKRKIRAAQHQNKPNSLLGLQEWAKLKPPNKERDIQKDALTLCKYWKLKQVNFPHKGPDEHYGNVIVTGDPVYIMGASTFTTNWTSCFAQPRGINRKTAWFYACCLGVKMAMILSDKEKIVCGVPRREIDTRCFIYETETEKKIMFGFYGNHKKELENILTEQGITYGGYGRINNRSYVKGEGFNVKLFLPPYAEKICFGNKARIFLTRV